MKILAGAALVSLLAVAGAGAAVDDKGLKAAFIFSFAKFTEWPGLAAGAPIVACIYRDESIASALRDAVKGQQINGHAVDVHAVTDNLGYRACQLVFIGGEESRQSRLARDSVSAMPVLTVSDVNGFAKAGGIIEMYVEDGRMRFAINVTAVERSGLVISARLLDLARIVRASDAF